MVPDGEDGTGLGRTLAQIRHDQSGGAGVWIAAGCFSMIALLALSGVAMVMAARYALNSMVETYTADSPLDMPMVQVSDEEYEALKSRVETFNRAMESGETAEPLVFTAEEVNALIQRSVDNVDLSDKVYVSIEDDRVTGEVSIPLAEFAGNWEILKGRYINGQGTFRVRLADGRLHVTLEELTVAGESVPEAIMEALRDENLARKMNEDPEFRKSISRLESVEVREGKIFVYPKSPGARTDEIQVPEAATEEAAEFI